jgi:hypothetical protein
VLVLVLRLRLRLTSGEGRLVADDAGGKEDTELWWVVSAGTEILLVFLVA